MMFQGILLLFSWSRWLDERHVFQDVSNFSRRTCTKNDWITFWQIVYLSCMTHFFHFSSRIITSTSFANSINIVPRFFSEVVGWETCLSRCRKFLSMDKHLHEHQCQFQEVHDEDYWNDRSSNKIIDWQ